MRTTTKTTPVLAALAGLSLILAGCATTADNEEPDLYGDLYDGESTAAYGTAFPVSSPEEAYRNGDAAARSGDFDRALFEYIRGLRLEDDPPADILYKIGSIHHERANQPLADIAYRWALEVQPGHPDAGTGLGIMLFQQRKYSEAEAQLRPIARGEDATWRAHNTLGILADLREQFGQAEREYNRALELAPGHHVILNNLGYSRYLAGDLQKARGALRQALRSNPDYEIAWRNLGLVLTRIGDYDEAVEAFARNGSRAEAYNDIGYVRMLEGDYAGAADFFEEAKRLSPSFYVTANENARQAKRQMRRHAGAQ